VLAGVDGAKAPQQKLEARKMLENAAESHTSGAPSENANVLFPERNRGAMRVYCEVAAI
jgi:hypothetical protein